jgi:hypothetical protein
VAIVPRSRCGTGRRKLDARRAGADDRERQPRRPRGVVRLQLGDLEGVEDPAAQLQRVVDRLHPGRVDGVLVVPKLDCDAPEATIRLS